MLTIEGLRVVYPRTGVAVDGLDVTVERGEAVAILGPNGAGKTTTVRAVTGFLSSERVSVDARRLEFDGASILRKPPHRIARAGIAVVPERDKVFRELLVEENLEVARGRSGDQALQDTQDMLDELFPILVERRKEQAGLLSGGQIQMLAIAMSVLKRPTLLVADEISLGLAPALMDEIVVALDKIRDELDLTMLLVEQNVGVARRLCSRGLVLESGHVRATGTMDELAADDSLANIYLGGTA